MLLFLRKIVSVCESKENKKFFFSRETNTRRFIIVFGESQVRHKLENYCNWFDNSKLIRNLSCGFSLQREKVFHVNICVLVCDCYFELLILVIILFGTQQVVLEPMVVWGKNGKVIEVLFPVRVGTVCVYFEPFRKWSCDGSPSQLVWVYCTK